MTTTTQPAAPAPFTADDYAARMRRVVADATDAGLDGLVVTPGPDLFWLTGYRPTAITERLTVLVLAPDQEPTLLVPTLERPDAESAVGADGLTIVSWDDHGDRRLGVGDAPARSPGRGARVLVPVPDLEPAHAACGEGRQRAGPPGSR